MNTILFVTFIWTTFPNPEQIGEGKDRKTWSIDRYSAINADEVHRAISERSELSAKCTIEWSETVFYPKGCNTGEMYRVPPEVIIPASDKMVRTKNLLVKNLDKMKFDFDGWEWSGFNNDLVKRQAEAYFDGETAKELITDAIATRSDGIVLNVSYLPESPSDRLRVLMLHIAPYKSGAATDNLKNYAIDNNPVEINGHYCIKMMGGTQNTKETLYVDPNMNFVIRRIEHSGRGRINFRGDIEYAWKSGTYYPTQWRFIRNKANGEGILRQINGRAIRYGEPSTEDYKKLDYEFPYNTFVTDLRTEPRTCYIQKERGQKRLITKVELENRVGYRELVNSEPDHAKITVRKFRDYTEILLLNIVMAGIFGTLMLLKRFRRAFQKRHHEADPQMGGPDAGSSPASR